MPASNLRAHSRRFLIACIAAVSPAMAQYVPIGLDVAGTRFKMPNEGYLQYQQNPIVTRFGDEYTGWIDIRHPARQSATAADNNTAFGYDMSDHSLNIRTTTLRVNDNPGGSAEPSPLRDFDYANQVWAQAGLSMIQSAHRLYKSGDAVPGGNPVNFAFPANFTPLATSPFGNSGNVGTVARELAGNNTSKQFDVFYGRTLSGAGLRGYAYSSGAESVDVANNKIFNPFAVVGTNGTDAGVADTFAHEVGHFLLNGPSVDNPGAGGHSLTKTNLMADGGIRWFPGQAAGNIGPGDPPSAIPQELVRVGPSIHLNGDGTPKVGGIDQLTAGNTAQSQVKRVFDSTGNNTTTRWMNLNINAGAANRVDFDFAADVGRRDGNINGLDVLNLDGVAGADNFTGASGERLYFGLPSGAVAPSAGGDKNKTGLGNFGATPDFAGNSFKYADVFSLTVRYSDWDSDTSQELSIREGALDYEVRFRNAAGQENPGTPVLVFQDGWSSSTSVDNYLARWTPSDPNFVATGLFILALDGTFGGSKYDAVTQIDAVIVSQVLPEPTALIVTGSLIGLCLRRARR